MGVPTGAQEFWMQTCSRPQSMALVQLGGAQTSCSLQVAPRAQSWFFWHGLPTGVQTEAMQLLPASQSPEREHCGSEAHIPWMQDAPAGHSDAAEHCWWTLPEQPATASTVNRTPKTAEEMRTENGRPCTGRVCRAFACSGIR
jgi:hypothetical protein